MEALWQRENAALQQKRQPIRTKIGDIRTPANSIKTDHELGLALLQTGNLDARLLVRDIKRLDLENVG
ncbi:hypothetical protein [Pedobacter yulinensis]|nr:hypothetical protein [Pedobacter yulinensis]